MNSRLILPLCDQVDGAELDHLSEDVFDSKDVSDPTRIRNTLSKKEAAVWRKLITKVKRVIDGTETGLTLGDLYLFLEKLRSKKESSSNIRHFFRRAVNCSLNQKGQKALDCGDISVLIAYEQRERFRNPPAHTRFLPLLVAEECQTFVEDGLEKLFIWTEIDGPPFNNKQ